uniref:DUF6188 family protein n=1 Tax=Streptomyces sp. NBC_00008 TaxID=2903610 RepID=A0AAU2VNF5_9ACTN
MPPDARRLWHGSPACSPRSSPKPRVTGLGTLSLCFDDGTRLGVGADPDHESWSLTGSGLEPVQVGPGGETGRRH